MRNLHQIILGIFMANLHIYNSVMEKFLAAFGNLSFAYAINLDFTFFEIDTKHFQ